MRRHALVVLGVVLFAAGCVGPFAKRAKHGPAGAGGSTTAPAARQPAVALTPPPVVVPAKPRFVWVPKWKMYVLEGHDIVYYKQAYYYHHAGYWWLGESHTGPWAVVMAPPPAVRQLPAGRLHAHIPPGAKSCPPGHAKQGRC